MPSEGLEAVQFREWGRWHAVRSDDTDRTFCGRNAINARRMYEQWGDIDDRCRPCERAVATAPPRRIEDFERTD
jgi:hypothetical protein